MGALVLGIINGIPQGQQRARRWLFGPPPLLGQNGSRGIIPQRPLVSHKNAGFRVIAGGDYQGLKGQQTQDAVRDNDDLFSRGNRGQRFSQKQIVQFLAFFQGKTTGLGIKQRLHKLPDLGFQGFPAQGQRMQVLYPILAHHKNVAGLFTQGIFYEHLVIGQGHIFDRQRFGMVPGPHRVAGFAAVRRSEFQTRR